MERSLPSRIADAHNDLLVELAFRAADDNPFRKYWLEPLRAGGVTLQVCPVSTAFERLPEGALREALEQVGAFHRALGENPTDLFQVEGRADLEALRDDGPIGLILAMEGMEPLGYSPSMADIFWQLGVRVFGLTWNRRNPFADGIGEPAHGGLSRLGRQLVARLAELGALVDLSHASERTFLDVLERNDRNVLVSHAACRALCDTPRNLSDEQLRALAGAGGLLGLMVLPPTIDPDDPTIGRVVDHLDHAVEVMGPEHVCLGADFFRQVALSGAVRKPPDSLRPPGMGLDYSIDDLSGPEHLPNLVAVLEARGYEGDVLDGVLRGNLLRFLGRTLP